MKGQKQVTSTQEIPQWQTDVATIIENIPDAFIAFDKNWRYIYVNSRAEEMLKRTKEDLIGKTVLEIAPEAKKMELFKIGQKALKTGKRLQYKYFSPLAKKWLQATFYPTTNGISAYFSDITQSKKNEETILMQAQILESMTEGVSVSDEQGIIKYTNAAEDEMFGYERGELIGQHVSVQNSYPQKENKKIINEVIKQLKKKGSWIGEWKNKRKDGTPFITASHITAIEIEGKKHFVCIQEDITEQKEYEEALAESEKRFRTLFEQSTDAIQLVNPEGNILFSSESIKNVLGYTPEELEGKGVDPFLHPEDKAMFLKKIKELLKTPKKHVTLEYRVKHKNGSWAWLETDGVNHLNTPGIHALVGTFRNITDRKLTEEALKQSIQDFKNLADTIPQIVWVTRPDGYHEYYNKRWYEYTGTSYDNTKGKGWNKMFHPEDRETAWEKWKYSLETGEPYEVEYRLKEGKSGKYRWFLGRALPIKDEKGNITKWFGTCTDIHEQKQLEQRKDEFISIASHELKTPLTSIKGYTQILSRMIKKTDNQRADKYLTKTNIYVNRLDSLISDLLDVSKIQAGKLQLNKETFDLFNLIQDSIDAVQLTSTTHKIIWKNKLHTQIHGDKNRLEQVVVNLLGNAIKYSPDSDKIVIKSFRKNDSVIISIQDFGVGISASSQKKLFRRFYRVENTEQQFSGLGIGLYISDEIVRRHNGRISVKSEEGKGSVFSITLPLHEKE